MVSQASEHEVAAPPEREPPRSILIARQFMLVGAVLSLASAVLGWAVGLPNYRDALHREGDLSSSDITLTLWLTFLITLGFAGVGVLIWLWMAWKNGQGRPWARVLGTTFFAISTLGTLGLVWTPRNESVAEIVLSVAIWIVGLGAVIFMWQRESTVYYHLTAARRAAD